ncbi:MAG: sugar transferase [Pseudomonadota bacterium]
MGFQSYSRDLVEAKSTPVDVKFSSRAKRATDVVIAAGMLCFLLPILLPIALIIRLSDGGPALFRQQRIGRDGEMFWCYKFRTMVTDADVRLEKLLLEDPVARRQWRLAQKLDNDPRITKLGYFLRKSSLDELPQLINILMGDMSLVGPRPIVRSEIEKYGEYFRDYCRVRPGLTGLWQISGRSDTTYQERVNFDVKYVDEWTYAEDIKIILKTVPAVLRSNGAR